MVLWPNWLTNFTRGLSLHPMAQVGLANGDPTRHDVGTRIFPGRIRTGTFKGHADAGVVCK